MLGAVDPRLHRHPEPQRRANRLCTGLPYELHQPPCWYIEVSGAKCVPLANGVKKVTQQILPTGSMWMKVCLCVRTDQDDRTSVGCTSEFHSVVVRRTPDASNRACQPLGLPKCQLRTRASRFLFMKALHHDARERNMIATTMVHQDLRVACVHHVYGLCVGIV